MNVGSVCSCGGVWSEVAVSLNSKDVQIFSKTRDDWKATETLSEVCDTLLAEGSAKDHGR